jgi:hypothetical protein
MRGATSRRPDAVYSEVAAWADCLLRCDEATPEVAYLGGRLTDFEVEQALQGHLITRDGDTSGLGEERAEASLIGYCAPECYRSS